MGPVVKEGVHSGEILKYKSLGSDAFSKDPELALAYYRKCLPYLPMSDDAKVCRV